MSNIGLQVLSRKLLSKRGDRGIREVAKEIGISPATLSRIERGHLPDIETFRKVCKWLNIDPSKILGVKPHINENPKISVHFRKDITLKPDTAEALAELILAAQRAMLASEEFIVESEEVE
jgi:transcriptional regulator with XRE-family HTH domain